MGRRGRTGDAWRSYLDAFHRDRAGVTEQLLRRCRSDGNDPYDWCTAPLQGGRGPIVDVGCGSGPVAAGLAGWVGTDRSSAELALARAGERSPLVLADAAMLPFGGGRFAASVLVMSLQVLTPLAQVLGEVVRVVRPGGSVVAMVPARGPLPLRDAVLYLRLQGRLRRRLFYPNDRLLAGRRVRRRMRAAGLELVEDARRSFRYPLDDDRAAELLISSLYLPGQDGRRVARGLDLLRRRVGGDVAVPLRRLVLRRSDER